jgi:hypothetical protein
MGAFFAPAVSKTGPAPAWTQVGGWQIRQRLLRRGRHRDQVGHCQQEARSADGGATVRPASDPFSRW